MESIGFGTCNCIHPLVAPGGPCVASDIARLREDFQEILSWYQEDMKRGHVFAPSIRYAAEEALEQIKALSPKEGE